MHNILALLFAVAQNVYEKVVKHLAYGIISWANPNKCPWDHTSSLVTIRQIAAILPIIRNMKYLITNTPVHRKKYNSVHTHQVADNHQSRFDICIFVMKCWAWLLLTNILAPENDLGTVDMIFVIICQELGWV